MFSSNAGRLQRVEKPELNLPTQTPLFFGKTDTTSHVLAPHSIFPCTEVTGQTLMLMTTLFQQCKSNGNYNNNKKSLLYNHCCHDTFTSCIIGSSSSFAMLEYKKLFLGLFLGTTWKKIETSYESLPQCHAAQRICSGSLGSVQWQCLACWQDQVPCTAQSWPTVTKFKTQANVSEIGKFLQLFWKPAVT